MNKSKWHSRLVNLAVVLTLVFSLAGIALLPVSADPGAVLGVTVDTDKDTYCCSENVTVRATITNSGNETAVNVTGGISWFPSGALTKLTPPGDPTWGFNISAGGSRAVTWTLHCKGPGSVTIKVEAQEDGVSKVFGQKTILQQSAELEVDITYPDRLCDRSWLVCSTYNLTFTITNTGCRDATLVTATITPDATIEVVVGGVGKGGGVPWTIPSQGTLEPQQSVNWTQEMHCVEAALGGSIDVAPNGRDACTEKQINPYYRHSDIVEINQYEPVEVTCDAKPNPTKHCYNVTFTAEASGGIPPYSWNWTFGDGNWTAGTDWNGEEFEVLHHYSNNTTAPLVFEACVTVTDQCANSDICCQNITVNPPLEMVSCNATPEETKVGYPTEFTVTHTGGVPDYTYSWDFGDTKGTSDEQNPTYAYPTAGNYTYCVNVTDSLQNLVTCCHNITVHDELSVSCNATPNPTKVCHNVTFTGTASGGFPAEACNYTWTWDFDDGTSYNGTGYSPIEAIHHYGEAGNYTATLTLTDDCLGNVASCNVTVQVNPPLTVSCNATPTVTKVCHNITFTAEASGGVEPYSWDWDFDDGSTHADTQNTTHHYAAAGNYTVTVRVTDKLRNEECCNVTVQVHPPLEVECEVEPEVVHVCHEVTFIAWRSGGVPEDICDYTWFWDFGDGTNSTAQNVTHAYMCVGNYTATVTVKDCLEPVNEASCNVTVEVFISPPGLVSPPNGAQITTSKNVTFEWEDIGCCDYTIIVFQKPPYQIEPVVVVEEDVGKETTYSHILFNDNYGWYVIAKDACGNTAQSATWYFQVDVTEDTTPPSVKVKVPNGGETFRGGTQATITWAANDYWLTGSFGTVINGVDHIDLYYKYDGGAWITIATDEVNDGEYLWTVPEINSTRCLIRVDATDVAGNTGSDTSDGVFTITSEPVCPASYNITLSAGWNLISLPLIPTNSTIEAVLAGVSGVGSVTQVHAWDAQTQSYLSYIAGLGGTLTTMEDGPGYWVSANGTATLTVTGDCMPEPPNPPRSYQVYAGWNLIGIKSVITRTHDDYLYNVAGKYSVIWGYDGAYSLVFPSPPGTGQMPAGSGFWIWMTQDGTIVPPGN